jgi:hypothetical protein
VQSPQPEKSKPPVKIEERGRILGIGVSSSNPLIAMRCAEWYSKHLGLGDKGVMRPWRYLEADVRPAGLNELSLMWDSGMREFPPRSPHQPTFYPVANRDTQHR